MKDFLDWIDIVKTLGLFTLLSWVSKNIVSYFKAKKQREFDTLNNLAKNDEQLRAMDNMLQSAIQAMLHNELYKNCNEYIMRGYITPAERDNLGYIFKEYKALGGNGTGESIYKQAIALPLETEKTTD